MQRGPYWNWQDREKSVSRNAASRDESRSNQKSPKTKINEKVPTHPTWEVTYPSFHEGSSRRKLPPRNALIENRLKKSPQQHNPQYRQSKPLTSYRSGNKVPRSDSCRSNNKSRPEHLPQTGQFLKLRHRKQYAQVRRKAQAARFFGG